MGKYGRVYYQNIEYDENFDNEAKIKEYHETHDKELRNKIIENNMPLVFSVANEYCYPARIDVNDLISIGAFGLIEAIEKFAFKNKFSTYARTIIKNTIVEEVCKEHAYGKYYYGRFVIRYRQLAISIFGEKATIFTPEVIDYVLGEMIERKEITEKTAEPVRRIIESHGNLVTPEELESIPYEEDNEAFEIREFITNYYEELTSTLTKEEEQIVRYKCGFVGGRTYNQDEIGEMLGLTHQAISLREKKIYKKMYNIAKKYV